MTADLVEAETVQEVKFPLVQSDVADHEVDLDMEWYVSVDAEEVPSFLYPFMVRWCSTIEDSRLW